MTYTDETIKKLEKRLAVKNGNYHILMIVLVDGSDLEHAPEPDLKRSGIIAHFLDWKSSIDYLKKMVARYGLISNIKTLHQPETYEMLAAKAADGASGKNPRKQFDGRTEMEDAINYFDATMEVENTLKENFPSRVKNTKTSRPDKSKFVERDRLKRHSSLISRVYAPDSIDAIHPEGVLDQHKAVEYRQNDKKPTADYVEYQLFDDDDTYLQGKNVVVKGEVDHRKLLPHFEQTDIRKSKHRKVVVPKK
jgi:hypothetical protein